MAESPTAHREAVALGCLGTLFPAAHLAQGIVELQKKRVRIPFCARCRLDYFLPAPGARLPLCGFILLVAASLYSLFHLENLALGFGLIAASFLPLNFVMLKSGAHEARAQPMKIFYEKGRYRYLVRAGPFVEYFRAYPSSNLADLKRNLILRYNQQRPGVVEI